MKILLIGVTEFIGKYSVIMLLRDNELFVLVRNFAIDSISNITAKVFGYNCNLTLKVEYVKKII